MRAIRAVRLDDRRALFSRSGKLVCGGIPGRLVGDPDITQFLGLLPVRWDEKVDPDRRALSLR